MRIFFNCIGVIGLLLFCVLSFRVFNMESILAQVYALLQRPTLLFSLTCLYMLAFLLRAYAWRLYLQGNITVREGLYGLLYSLLVNHVSPLKIGDAVRIAVVTKQGRVSFAEAAQSVIILRLLDLLTLGLFGAFGTLLLFQTVSVRVLLFIAGCLLLFSGTWLLRKKAPHFLEKHVLQLHEAVRGRRGLTIVYLVVASWVCEAFVIFGISQDLLFWEAVWVNSVTIAGQVFQLTPGGIGTYETVMTFALQAVHVPVQQAYEWALLSHGFKFIFSYAVGLVVLVVHPIQLTSYLRYKQKGE